MKHLCIKSLFGRDWSIGDKPKVIYCEKLYGNLKQKNTFNSKTYAGHPHRILREKNSDQAIR